MDFFYKLNIKQINQINQEKNPNLTDLIKKTKIIELENKIPNVSGLATKSALTTVENEIPDVSNLVKKTN